MRPKGIRPAHPMYPMCAIVFEYEPKFFFTVNENPPIRLMGKL